MDRSAPASLPPCQRGPVRSSACACGRSGCRCSTSPRAGRCAARSMTVPAMAEVVLDRVAKRFGEVVAVDGLSLTIGDGELVVLLGPTGAGKTTTLRLIA